MELTKYKIGDKLIIKSIDTDPQTRKRIRSFGLSIGNVVEVRQISIAQKNIEISSNHGLIALRDNEAKSLQCEKII